MRKALSSKRKIFTFAVLIPSSAVLLLYIYLGSYARMIADDFCSAYFARRLGLLRSIWYWYKNWHGGYADAAADWLLEKIGIHALPIIISLTIFVWLVFIIIVIHLQLRHYPSQGKSWGTGLSLGAIFLFAVLLLSPHIQQSLYWWNGMRAYSLPLVLLTLYLVLLQIGVERLTNKKEIILGAALSFLFLFINGGLGETYVAFQVVVLGFLLMLELLASMNHRSAQFRFLLAGVIGSVASLIVVVSAPGNTIRQDYFPPPPDLARLFEISIQGYLDLIFEIVRSPGKITGLLGSILIAIYFGSHYERRVKVNRWLIPTLFLGAFILSFACFVPAAYGTSEPTPPRTITIPVFGLVACLLWAVFLVGQQLPESSKASSILGTVIPIIAILLINYSALSNAQYLYKSRNMYVEFAHNWDIADKLIQQAKSSGEKSVSIPALNVYTGPGGDPTDNPKYWVNQCYSLYYGIQVLGPSPGAQQP